MLHHVSYEVPPALVGRMGELLGCIGFERVPAPEALGDGYTWFERGGRPGPGVPASQVHLISTEEATAPPVGHAAFVVDDLDATLARLEGSGFEVREARRLWGERRVFVSAPGGHRIELFAVPPSRRSSP